MTVEEIVKNDPEGLIARAFRFSQKAHSGQKRKSGEPYFNHALAAAETLRKWRLDEATIAAGLLHDTVEDNPATAQELRKEFGAEIAFLVDGVTKLGRIKYRGLQAKVENLRKMIFAISEDLRVVFIKLADRLHNMKTLSALPPAKQKRIALETSEVYAAIAYRLGMWELSGELQDLAFPYLHPGEYRWLKENVAEEYGTRTRYLEQIRPLFEEMLEKAGLKPLVIDFRAKRYYSLYQKLLRYDMDINKIYDLVALRAIFETIPECYAALGVIHQHWPPLPGRIKDYIAMPKANNYRSLHTTIIGPEGRYLEIQLRTKEMHEENEYGIAAHWLYKQRSLTLGAEERAGRWSKRISETLEWIKQLRKWQEKQQELETKPEEFLETMKIDFFKDRIFVITPKGDVIDLPAGSTPIDFAYQIHSEVGDSCVGAKVNDKFVPLNHELRSGDLVYIITQKNKRPSEDWLKFVKTSLAREHIKASLRQKKRLQTRKAISRAEIRLVAQQRLGLLKDISAIISRKHITIVKLRTSPQAGSQFYNYKIECATTDKNKIEKLILKLKKLKEVKEISYQLI